MEKLLGHNVNCDVKKKSRYNSSKEKNKKAALIGINKNISLIDYSARVDLHTSSPNNTKKFFFVLISINFLTFSTLFLDS